MGGRKRPEYPAYADFINLTIRKQKPLVSFLHSLKVLAMMADAPQG
ncbi:hypothetical protein BN2497_12193 [Janthinobacterium sp. CG23_2]|nr:hypothetical protein BN2497_12193 [Janthinobacterium sp. CG23_2]CUU32494.1 hypothetical protein BN3177_12193 [Janthinobacterium sp. CG23_2]